MRLVFFDPLHGGCLRVVVPEGGAYRIHGAYGDDEAPKRPGAYWWATATVLERSPGGREKWTVDFHPGKPLKSPRVLRATFEPARRRIVWEDTNVWQQLYFHPRQTALLTGTTKKPTPRKRSS